MLRHRPTARTASTRRSPASPQPSSARTRCCWTTCWTDEAPLGLRRAGRPFAGAPGSACPRRSPSTRTKGERDEGDGQGQRRAPRGGGRRKGQRRAGHAPERRGGSGEREQRGVGNRGGSTRAHGDRRRTRNLRHHRARRRGTHGTRSDRPSRAGADPNAARGRSSLAAQGQVLAVLLAASLVVHFPVFCLFCPIELAFGTLFAASRMFVTWQPGWELIVFPAHAAGRGVPAAALVHGHLPA